MLPLCLKLENSRYSYVYDWWKGKFCKSGIRVKNVLSCFSCHLMYSNFTTTLSRGMTHQHFRAQAAPSAEEHHVVSNREVAGQSCTAPDNSGIDSVQTLVAKKRIVPPVFLHIVWKEGRCVATCSYLTRWCHSGWGWLQQTMPQCFVCNGCT